MSWKVLSYVESCCFLLLYWICYCLEEDLWINENSELIPFLKNTSLLQLIATDTERKQPQSSLQATVFSLAPSHLVARGCCCFIHLISIWFHLYGNHAFVIFCGLAVRHLFPDWSALYNHHCIVYCAIDVQGFYTQLLRCAQETLAMPSFHA